MRHVRCRGLIRSSLAFLLFSFLLPASLLPAQSPPVRYKEGPSHGFLTVRDPAGHVIAAGELTQSMHGRQIVSRLTFHFKDGSLDDETTTFTQDGGFHVLHDRHIQKGPSFPGGQDLVFDTAAQQLTARDADTPGPPPPPQHFDLPADTCNGIILTLVKNLRPGDPEIKVPYLAVSGKPRLVHLAMSPEQAVRFHVAGHAFPAERYVIKVELGGLTGMVAPMLGKQPPDAHVWVAEGPVPAVVRLDTALYFGGPMWSIRLAAPVW